MGHDGQGGRLQQGIVTLAQSRKSSCSIKTGITFVTR